MTIAKKRNEVDETLRVFDKGFFYSLGKHIKDIGGIGLMYLSVLFGVCYKMVEKTASSFIIVGQEKETIRYECFEMMRSITFIGILLLVINMLSIWYGFSHAKTIKYRLIHNIMNIVAYIYVIYFAKCAGLVCTELHDITSGFHNKCYYYSQAAFIYSLFMIGVYGICSVIAIAKRDKINAEAMKEYLNN